MFLQLWMFACGSAAPITPASTASVEPEARVTELEAPCDATDFSVAVDIGHTPDAPGATSARGRPEHAFNRDLAQQIVARLHAAGFQDSFLIDPAIQPLSLADRPALARTGGARVFLSVHHDSAQQQFLEAWTHDGESRLHTERFSGHSLFVSQAGETAGANLALGLAVGRSLLAAVGSPTLHHAADIPGERRQLLDASLGLYRRDTLAVLREATLPALLLEGGVIVNRVDELQLQTLAHQTRLADAVVEGVRAFCAIAQAEVPPV